MPEMALMPITPSRQKLCLCQHPHQLLDVARITPDDQRRQVLDGADDSARLPLQRRLAPTLEPRLSVGPGRTPSSASRR